MPHPAFASTQQRALTHRRFRRARRILDRFTVSLIRTITPISIQIAIERFAVLLRFSFATAVGSAALTEALMTAQGLTVLSRPYGGDSSRLSRRHEHVVELDFARAFPSSANPHTE